MKNHFRFIRVQLAIYLEYSKAIKTKLFSFFSEWILFNCIENADIRIDCDFAGTYCSLSRFRSAGKIFELFKIDIESFSTVINHLKTNSQKYDPVRDTVLQFGPSAVSINAFWKKLIKHSTA